MNNPMHIQLSSVDVAFADLLQRQAAAHADAWLLAALTSHAYRAGHACLLLDEGLTSIIIHHTNAITLERLSPQWPEQQTCCSWWQSNDESSPLVWQDNRLYMRRAWQDEQTIQLNIQQRLALRDNNQIVLTNWLTSLFPASGAQTNEPNWQAIACALATRAQFSIITGGPGTGKTTTVVRLLATLQRLAQASSTTQSLRIGLSAPTGKAAARLASSIQQAISQLPAAFQLNLPTQAQTLHKWLASDELTQSDCFIVDEASMIDLHLMAQLLTKLPVSTRLILLGDKDQLASVDAGAVLGQLCRGAEQGNYSAETQQWLLAFAGQQLPSTYCSSMGNALAQQTIMLRYSHRFDASSAIGQWATWVNQQAVKSVKAAYTQLPIWTIDTSEAVVALPIIANDTQKLKQLCLAQWQRLSVSIHEDVDEEAIDSWAKKCLGQLSEFQLLCAVREGPWGLVSMNERMAKWFGLDSSQWLAGRVVMVTRNDYTLNLMNGDIGLCLPHPRLGLRVVFATEKGIRWILPARLSHIEDAFAMSVHKSQGSEFNRVCLLLPEQDSPILTKELIYTAITRAKHQFILACTSPQQLFTAVGRSVQRAGGLSFV